jgi:hypothetical protein
MERAFLPPLRGLVRWISNPRAHARGYSLPRFRRWNAVRLAAEKRWSATAL